MSLLNIKQIAGPGVGGRAPTGAIPVFDGNSVRWSNNATTALQLPTGTAAQRPTGIAGLIRYNTDSAKLEAFENGAWNNVVNPIKSFLDLADAPKTYSGFSGKVLAVNAAGTGIEYIDPTVTIDKIKGATAAQAGNYVAVKPDGSGLQYLPFPSIGNIRTAKMRINFASTYLDTTTPTSEMPDGWSATASVAGSNLSTLTVDHTLGAAPIYAFMNGYEGSTTGMFKFRPVGTTALELKYGGANAATRFVITGLSTTNTGAGANQYAYLYLFYYI